MNPTPTSRMRQAGRIVVRASLKAAAVLAVLYIAIVMVSAHILTRADPDPYEIDPHQVADGIVPWSTGTADGLTLRGWYAPTAEKEHLIVLVHGMRASWSHMASLGRDLHARGYDVLLFDLRGHGRSDPSRLTMGRCERGDLRAVLAWAKARGFTPDRIGWVGHSMGASTLLMEGAQNAEIRTAVVDSPYGNLPELLDAQLVAHSHLPRVFNPGILLAARYAFGVRTDDLIPIRSAKDWRDRPLLLFHGEEDSIVPVGQARQMAKVAGPSCRAIVLPGVEHVGAYRYDPGRYIAAIDRFFRETLRPRRPVAHLSRPSSRASFPISTYGDAISPRAVLELGETMSPRCFRAAPDSIGGRGRGPSRPLAGVVEVMGLFVADETSRTISGFAWLVYVADLDDPDLPTYPFPTGEQGEIVLPQNVVYSWPLSEVDQGITIDHEGATFLVITRRVESPTLIRGWDAEPAKLAANFRSEFGDIALKRITSRLRTSKGTIFRGEFEILGDLPS